MATYASLMSVLVLQPSLGLLPKRFMHTWHIAPRGVHKLEQALIYLEFIADIFWHTLANVFSLCRTPLIPSVVAVLKSAVDPRVCERCFCTLKIFSIFHSSGRSKQTCTDHRRACRYRCHHYSRASGRCLHRACCS